MPAPQASMMKNLAKLQFSSFALKVPTDWQQPQGDPAGKHYGDAFQPSEKATAPATAAPPLFQPASMNKYHTDTQKKLTQQFGDFIDGICTAICSAWGNWQSTASMAGIIVNAVTATGGQVVGPPLTPLILAEAPKDGPSAIKYSTAVASVIGTAWLTYTASIKIPGLPFYPAFAAFPSPVAPPTPNVPVPLIALTQVAVGVSKMALKGQMVGQLGDPMAPFHKELFDCIADAFDKCFQLWQGTTMVTNVLGTGPVPTFAPPYVPVGPVMGGVGTMPPGGFK
jgi:hypothetical protein